jgi:hypothetical protein
MNHRLGSVTLGLLAMLMATGPAAAQTGITRYVNHTDATCGGHTPCYATIQAAVNAVQAADTIQIQAGLYVEQVEIAGKNMTGTTEASRIIIQADPAAAVGSVILHGAVTQCTNGFAIRVQQSKFITIRGLTITGAGAQGISLLGGNNQNTAIHIERNRIVGNGSASCGGGITIAGGNPHTLIVNNLIYANGGNGLATIDASGGPHDIIGNSIHGNGWSGMNITFNQQVFLVNNAITGNGTPGSMHGFGIVRETTPPPNLPYPAGSQLLNNLICGNQLGEISGPALDATDSGNLTPTGTEGPGVAASAGCDNTATVYKSLSGPDGLVGTADDDFTLATGSPAIDRGMDPRTLGLPTTFTPLLEADFTGDAARPRNGTGTPTALFDMGALEATVPDTQAPTVSFLQPAVNAHLRQTVTVQAQATDSGSGVLSLTLKADSQSLTATLSPTVPPPAASVTATASWNTTIFADGTHTLTATAADQGSNPASAQRVVIVDNTPPQAQITDGPSGQITSTSATLTYTGTDNLTPVGSLVFAWRLDGGAYTPFAAATTASVSGLADGLHLFEVKVRDLAGNETALPASRTFTVSALSLQVTSPPAGATVQAGLLLVRGSVNAGGAEVGVTVNGRAAAVDGSAFTALVSVDRGTTQLTAVATTLTGATTSSTIPIGVTGVPSDAVVLRPSPESGIAPLQVSFSVSAPRPVTQVALDVDGNGSVDFQGASLDGQNFTYSQPGLYVASVAVTDSQGTQTSAAAIIQVFDRAQLDALLQGKWNALRDSLSRADVTGAVSLFAQASRDAYQDQLSALAGVGALGQVASDLGPIRLVRARTNAAEYEVRAIRNAVEYSFHVLFVVDGDGVWRLRAF